MSFGRDIGAEVAAGATPADAVNNGELGAGVPCRGVTCRGRSATPRAAPPAWRRRVGGGRAGGEFVASAIDPTRPEDGIPASKSAMRANWAAAKAEIEALQAGLPIVLLSGADHGVWIDLDSTVEQLLMVPHGLGAAPAGREVFVEPVAPVTLDLSEVCLEYIKYLEASSSATEMVFAVKLRTGSGTPGQQGELRVVLMSAG
jgi:hypothetical protein